MAKTLTLAGSNYLPFFKTSTAKIKETLRKSNVMNFEAVTQGISDAPQEGAEIVYKDGARFLFGGYVSRVQPVETGIGEHFKFAVEASDYAYIFNNKIVRRAYSNATLADIVADIMGDFVGSVYGFDITNVQTGPTIETIAFDHITVRKAFEKLSKTTGYVWYVDYEKKLYFQTVATTAAQETITDASDNVEEIQISYDTAQVRNSVTVIGSPNGVQSLDPIVQHFEGDGDTRAWELEEPPSQVIYINRGGVSQQYSLDVNERETDVFVYSFTGESFRLTTPEATPGVGDDIDISYYPRIPVIEQRNDSASIAFFAALDGGDGIYEYTVKDASIGSLEEAAERANQELEEYSMPLVEGSFKTRTGLLQAGTIFVPGQYLTVNLPSYGLSTDTAFLIQEVLVEVVEGSSTEYKYTVKFGGKIVGIQEFLETLASDQIESEEVAEDTEIITIQHVTDTALFEDVDADILKETPPYKYGNVLLDSYNESNGATLWGTRAAFPISGQSFTGDGKKITSCMFHLRKQGTITGSVTAELYAHSGTYGVNGVPTGSALATSLPFDVANLTTSFNLVYFEFDPDNRYQTVNGTKYFICYKYDAGDASNYVATQYDGTSPTHGGNLAEFTASGSVWTAYGSGGTNRDIPFYVFTTATNNGKYNLSEWG